MARAGHVGVTPSGVMQQCLVGWRYAREIRDVPGCLRGRSGPGRILQPDLTAEGDRGIDFGVGLQERVERRDEPPGPVTVQREARWHAHQAIGARAASQRFGEQRPEVPEITRDDRSLLVRKRREVDAVRASSQVGALANYDDVVAVFMQLPGDLGREVLIEQQLQAEIASWAARQVLSSRSLSVCTRSIQSSISSR
jgi:hypothetical protein